MVTVSALLTQLLCYCTLEIELLLTGLLWNVNKQPARTRKEIQGLSPRVSIVYLLSPY